MECSGKKVKLSDATIEELIGKRFGRLVVKEFLRAKTIKGKNQYHYYYACQCDCGTEVEKRRGNLITSHTLSCGCLKRLKGKNNKCWTGCGEISGKLWSNIRNKGLGRNLSFNITVEEAWNLFEVQNHKCALTGQQIGFDNRRTASLDRIDNKKGYEIGNVQWVHKDINWMKGRFTSERFVELCSLVSEHMKGER